MLPVGKNIRTLRRDRNMTQDELAKILGVTFQSVSRWENEIAYPDIELLPKIAACFGVTTDELLTERDNATLAEEREKRKWKLYGEIMNEEDETQKLALAMDAFREMPDEYDFAGDAVRILIRGQVKSREEALPIVRELCTVLLNQTVNPMFHSWALRWIFQYEDEDKLDNWQKYVSQYVTYPQLLEIRYSYTGERDRMNLQRQGNLFEMLKDAFPLRTYSEKETEEETARSMREGALFSLRLYDMFRDPSDDMDLWIKKRAWTYLFLAKTEFRLENREKAYEALEKSVELYEKILRLPPDYELRCGSPLFDQLTGCRLNWFNAIKEKSPRHQDSDYVNIHSALTGSDSQWNWMAPYREEERFQALLSRIESFSQSFWREKE